MDLRARDKSGRRVRIRVDERVVHPDAAAAAADEAGFGSWSDDPGHPSGAVEDPREDDDPWADGPDEGNSTQAVILVEPHPNTMTVEGSIAGIGIVARKINSDPYAVRRAWESSGLGRRRRIRANVMRFAALIATVGMVAYSVIRTWVR